jgi:acyl-CoA thioesterase FadM
MWKKFCFEGVVFIRDTDATARVFCPRPIEWVIEAFERVCFKKGQKDSEVAIVKAGVEFFFPFTWFDPYKMELTVQRVGNRSFDIRGEIFKEEKLAIKVDITFVLSKSSQDFLDSHWDKG